MSGTVIAIIGISFIFLMTTLGSAVVFFFKKPLSGRANSLFLGFASGVMLATSIWSLIVPSIEQSQSLGSFSWLPSAIGIIVGVVFLVLMDRLLPKILKLEKATYNKSGKMFVAMTLHNIPEGLAVGLAFGNALIGGEMSLFLSALYLAIGIGLQNFPEGSATTLPLKERFGSSRKAFGFGVLSGAVEPIMAVVGIFLARVLNPIMPYLLAFSAGAMLFVVAEELVPEAREAHPSYIGSWGFIIGFVLMMVLDVALG